MTDRINHPNHYTSHPTKVECHEITEWYPENIGAAMRYLWRAHLKGDAVGDIKKAIVHLKFELERIEKFGEEACLARWGREEG